MFDGYDRRVPGPIAQRVNGVMVSTVAGKALAYALFNLPDRGRLFIGHGDEVYEGMVVGIHSRGNDLIVNPTKAKQLTNIRAAGSDGHLLLTPPVTRVARLNLDLTRDLLRQLCVLVLGADSGPDLGYRRKESVADLGSAQQFEGFLLAREGSAKRGIVGRRQILRMDCYRSQSLLFDLDALTFS